MNLTAQPIREDAATNKSLFSMMHSALTALQSYSRQAQLYFRDGRHPPAGNNSVVSAKTRVCDLGVKCPLNDSGISVNL